MSFDIKTNLNPPNANTFNPYSLEIKDGVLINVHHKNWNGPIVIPEDAGIHTIGAGAFSNCQCNMVSIPESVKYLGNNAFINCTNLQRIDKIGEFAHNGIGDRPFEGVHRPVDINTTINGRVQKGFVKESALRDKFTKDFTEKPKSENYHNLASQFKEDPQPPLSIQNDKVCIKNGVLVNCNPTDKVISLPEGVNEIGLGAIAYCYNTTILAPTTLTTIGDYNLDNNLKLDCTIMTPQAIADLVNNYSRPNELLNHLTQESQNKAFPYLSAELKNEIIESNKEYNKQALGEKLSGISFSKGEYSSYTEPANSPDEKQVQAGKLNEARFSEQQYNYTDLKMPEGDNQIRSNKLAEKSFRDSPDSPECVNTDYLKQVFVTKEEPLGLNDFENFPEHNVSEPPVEFSFRSPTVQDNDLII